MSHTSNDLMEMMTALEEAGIKKPAHFLGLLHERGYHVAKNPRVEVAEKSNPERIQKTHLLTPHSMAEAEEALAADDGGGERLARAAE